MTATMRALIQDRYGSPDSLRLADVPAPMPAEGEVLVRVRAASLNAADIEILRGDPVIRVGALRRPKHRIPGSDVAGEVVALGPGVTELAVGDAVFGDLFATGFGAFAELVAVPARAMARKPADLAFEQVATLPQAAVLAWQGIHEPRPVAAGERVLINGAGGGVGTFAVQMAAAAGAQVTGVDRAAKEGLVRSLGATRFIDFTAVDPFRTGDRYDLVVDVQARHSVGSIRRALAPGGRYGAVGGPILRLGAVAALGRLARRAEGPSIGLVIWRANDPAITATLLAALREGRLTPVIERTYPLDEAPAAFRRLAAGEVLGKVVIVLP